MQTCIHNLYCSWKIIIKLATRLYWKILNIPSIHTHIAAEIGSNPVSKHQIQPERVLWAGWRGTGRPNPPRETKFSGANGNREIFIFPIRLITSRIGNLTRLIHTPLLVITIQHYTIHICTVRRICVEASAVSSKPLHGIKFILKKKQTGCILYRLVCRTRYKEPRLAGTVCTRIH